MRNGRVRNSKRERGSVLVVALLLMVLLSLLGITLLTVAATEHTVAYNGLWSEGALMAAEGGVNVGINQLSANADTSVQAIPATRLPDAQGPFQYRSGTRTSGVQALQFVSSRIESGYSIAVGTGYNRSGYVFDTYQINATGTGPRNAVREVEVQAEYGPIAR
jgi:Tfp pilus assembly protein PilX